MSVTDQTAGYCRKKKYHGDVPSHHQEMTPSSTLSSLAWNFNSEPDVCHCHAQVCDAVLDFFSFCTDSPCGIYTTQATCLVVTVYQD